MMMAAPLVLCSCSEDNDENPAGGGQTGTSEVVAPDLDEENLPFVGEWSGWGPYHASGTPSSSYGVVKGTWIFYNDGTYRWSGTNSYGYTYNEKGSWRYIPESKLLVTDGSCGLSWAVEEISNGQWVGTIQGKGGTYIYTKTDDGVEAGSVKVTDYGTNRLSVQSTLSNIRLANQSFKLGVCYGSQNNLEPSTYTKVYADSLDFDTGTFNIDITGLDNGKYRLRCFIEFGDGTSKYGTEYRAVSIRPSDDFVFLGETNKYMWVWFYGKSALLSDGSFAPEGSYGDEIAIDDVNGLCDKKDINPMSDEEMSFLSTLTSKIKTGGNDGKKYIHISGSGNSNELVLPFYDSSNSTWYYTSMRRSGESLMFRFSQSGSSARLSSGYRTDSHAYVLPVKRYTVRWN